MLLAYAPDFTGEQTSSANDQARAIAAGYQLHMAKPAEPGRLTNAVAKIAATATLRR